MCQKSINQSNEIVPTDKQGKQEIEISLQAKAYLFFNFFFFLQSF